MAEAFADLWVITYLHPITMGVFCAIGIFFVVATWLVVRRT